MRLLLDEMYPATIAEQLRARGHDVASVHDLAYRRLEGAPDDEIWATAIADDRALVSENVQDFRRIEAGALARRSGYPVDLHTDRQFRAAMRGRSVASCARSTRCFARRPIKRWPCSSSLRPGRDLVLAGEDREPSVGCGRMAPTSSTSSGCRPGMRGRGRSGSIRFSGR